MVGDVAQGLARKYRATARRDLIAALIVPIVVLGLWEGASRTGILDPRLFSMPSETAVEFWKMITSGMLLQDVTATVIRLLVGYGIGAVIGVGLGLALGYSRILRAALSPSLGALYAVPKIAFLPLLLLLFGLGETPLILITLLGSFFAMYVSTEAGVLQLDRSTREAGLTYGAKGWRYFWYVLLPGALPGVFSGLRIGAGLATTAIVAAEFVATEKGLGALIWRSWTLLQPPRMFVAIVVVALLGALFMQLIQWVEKMAIPWRAEPGARSKRLKRNPVI